MRPFVGLALLLASCRGPEPPKDLAALRRLWGELGIRSELFEDRPITVRTGAWGGLTTFTISDDTRWDWQILVFERGRLVGHADLPWQKGHEPAAAFSRSPAGDVLLRVHARTGSGTGVSRFSDLWFAMAEGRTSRILDLPRRGHVYGWGPPFDREFDSELSVGADVLQADYRVRYMNALEEDFPDLDRLFERTGRAVWRWTGGTFRFDPTLSTLRPDTLFDGGLRDFLEENSGELEALASTSEGARWVTHTRNLWVEQAASGR